MRIPLQNILPPLTEFFSCRITVVRWSRSIIKKEVKSSEYSETANISLLLEAIMLNKIAFMIFAAILAACAIAYVILTYYIYLSHLLIVIEVNQPEMSS